MTIQLKAGVRLVLATHNSGKVRELGDLLLPYGLTVSSSADLGLPEPEETGETFAENALIKARSAAKESGLLALADDSGLAVDALGGAPGIYSARWAGDAKDFSAAMGRVNEELSIKQALEPEDRGASFQCALALVSPSGDESVIKGEVHGHIVWPPRGELGFGYDSIFLPLGETRTFGEMDAVEKHGLKDPGRALSHRARAFLDLKNRYLATENNE